MAGRWLSRPTLVLLGGASYAIYLFHFQLNICARIGRSVGLPVRHAPLRGRTQHRGRWVIDRDFQVLRGAAKTPDSGPTGVTVSFLRQTQRLMVRAQGNPPRQKLFLLEALRGLAAFYVFIGHLARQCLPNTPPALRFLLGFGQEAVMLFFLLSGFVIFCCRNRPNMTFREYFLRRFARIYPIFVLGLALAYVASSIEAHQWLGLHFKDLAGNLLMLQDNNGAMREGTWFPPYMGGFSLWSSQLLSGGTTCCSFSSTSR